MQKKSTENRKSLEEYFDFTNSYELIIFMVWSLVVSGILLGTYFNLK